MNLPLLQLLNLARRVEAINRESFVLADRIREWASRNVIQFGLSETQIPEDIRRYGDNLDYQKYRKEHMAAQIAKGILDVIEWEEEKTFHGLKRTGRIWVICEKPKGGACE